MLAVKLRNLMTFRAANAAYMVILLPMYAGIIGCQTEAPAPPEPVEAQLALPPEPPRIDPIILHELLAAADEAMADEHLTYPEEGSALTILRSILAIEPGQEDAIRGLEHIVERYIELAERAMERGQYATARSMLARARIILPEHPSIKPTDEQIRLLANAQRTRLRLQQQDITDNTEAISAELRALARPPDATSCRFIISAKNDAQGRWIYQSLAQGATPNRVRAQIRIRLPAGVERLCFPA